MQTTLCMLLLSMRLYTYIQSQESAHQLYLAAKANDLAKASGLLRSGALPNIEDPDGGTPLTWACGMAHLKMVRLLLRNGARASYRCSYGETALTVASATGDVEILQALVHAGAKVNETENDGTTGLMYACRQGHQAAVRWLLKHGADPDCATDSGLTALHYATSSSSDGNAIVKQLLICGAIPDRVDADGNTPLMNAARQGRLQSVILLIRYGAKINRKNENGQTALMLALRDKSATHGSQLKDTIEYLKMKGAR